MSVSNFFGFRISDFLLKSFLFSFAMISLSPAQEIRTAVLQGEGYREVVATATLGESSTVPNSSSAAESLNKIAGGTNFIGGDDLKTTASLEEALSAQPGISVRHFVGGHETVNIRGSGLQSIPTIRGVYLLQDGLPMQRSDGSFLPDVMDPRSSQYIEVLRGANAFADGSTSLGGELNFVSHTGYDASLAQAGVEVGSFDYVGSQVSSGYCVGDTDYYISFTQADQTGYRVQNNQSKDTVNFNVGQKFGEDIETRFFGTMVQDIFEVPGPLSKLAAENHPVNVSTAPNILRDAPNRQIDLFRLANKTVWRDAEDQIELGISWLNIDDRIRRTKVRGVGHYNSNDWSGEIRYTTQGEIGEHWNKFTTALLPSLGQMQMTTFQNLNGSNGALLGNHDLYSANLNWLAENTFYILPDLAWIAGIQACYAYRQIDEKFSALTGMGDETLDYIGINPRMGLRYEFSPRNSLFFNASQSFEPPVFDDLLYTSGAPNANSDPTAFTLLQLAPQTATTLEIGTRGSESIFSWDVSFYHSWVENELLSYQNDVGTVVTENVNATTIHQGIEIGLTIDVLKDMMDQGDRLEWRTVYNWSNFYFQHHPRYGDNNLAAIPEHMLFSSLTYRHPCGFYFGPNVEWMITKTSVDESHSQFQDPYAVMGFRIGYKSKKGFSAFGQIDNLLEDTYTGSVMPRDRVASAATPSFMPGDAFAVKAGVEYRY